MQAKTLDGIAAEFARRNAAKAAKEAEKPPDKVCIGCGAVVANPLKFKDRVGPLCWECEGP